MEGWRTRLVGVQVAFREDDENDELEMQMALDQLQSFIDLEPSPKRRAGGSTSRKSPNIERAMIAMDNQMYLDYFVDPPIWGPRFFAADIVCGDPCLIQFWKRCVHGILTSCNGGMLMV